LSFYGSHECSLIDQNLMISPKILSSKSLLEKTIDDYYCHVGKPGFDLFVSNLISETQKQMKSKSVDIQAQGIFQILFLNNMGFRFEWSQFHILEMMAQDDFSIKRLCYCAASVIWSSNSDVVYMASNLIHRDFYSVQKNVSSIVLSSIGGYMNESLARIISSDIVSLMTSSIPYVRQKAISMFYTICIKNPDSLSLGFKILKGRLDDVNESVINVSLTVFYQFSIMYPEYLIALIPKFFSMLQDSKNKWAHLRLISILRNLCATETRLAKKLVGVFSSILETPSSLFVLFECIKSIVEIPVYNQTLLLYCSERLLQFIDDTIPTIRDLSIEYFLKLIRLDKNLFITHKKIVKKSIKSNNPNIAILAIQTVMELTTNNNIDRVIKLLMISFNSILEVPIKQAILKKVIDICSNNDYQNVTDFEWYINVLAKFAESGHPLFNPLILNEFSILSESIPSLREHLSNTLCLLLIHKNNRGNQDFLISIINIIATYSTDISVVHRILDPSILFCSKRVQLYCLQSSFFIILRNNYSGLNFQIFDAFRTSQHNEVTLFSEFLKLTLIDSFSFNSDSLANRIIARIDNPIVTEISVPLEIIEPIPLFMDSDESPDPVPIVSSINEPEKHQITKKHRKQKKIDKSSVIIKVNKRSLLTLDK